MSSGGVISLLEGYQPDLAELLPAQYVCMIAWSGIEILDRRAALANSDSHICSQTPKTPKRAPPHPPPPSFVRMSVGLMIDNGRGNLFCCWQASRVAHPPINVAHQRRTIQFRPWRQASWHESPATPRWQSGYPRRSRWSQSHRPHPGTSTSDRP